VRRSRRRTLPDQAKPHQPCSPRSTRSSTGNALCTSHGRVCFLPCIPGRATLERLRALPACTVAAAVGIRSLTAVASPLAQPAGSQQQRRQRPWQPRRLHGSSLCAPQPRQRQYRHPQAAAGRWGTFGTYPAVAAEHGSGEREQAAARIAHHTAQAKVSQEDWVIRGCPPGLRAAPAFGSASGECGCEQQPFVEVDHLGRPHWGPPHQQPVCAVCSAHTCAWRRDLRGGCQPRS
jgi:hypothetical protein